jgi:hypothetical protein
MFGLVAGINANFIEVVDVTNGRSRLINSKNVIGPDHVTVSLPTIGSGIVAGGIKITLSRRYELLFELCLRDVSLSGCPFSMLANHRILSIQPCPKYHYIVIR